MELSGRLKSTILNNVSLLIVVLGALSNFILILFIKRFLPELFNVYSLYLTYLAIIVSFGLIGFDQVLLRLATIEKDKIGLSKDIFRLLLFSGIATPFAIGYYFHLHYEGLDFLSLIFSGLAINLMIFSFNILRLQKKFVISQFFQNGYKIAFLVFIGLFYFRDFITEANIIRVSAIILCGIGIWAGFKLIQNLRITPGRTPSLFNFFLSFSINMALLTLLSYGERILIVNEMGEDAFGKYFYYSTVFLFPLTLIQYYVGFKELVFFKEKRDSNLLHQKLKKIFLSGVILIACVFAVVWVDNGTFLAIDISENLWLVILLSFLGISKLIYGLFSALLGAVANYQDMYIINLLTAFLMAVLLITLLTIGISLNSVIMGLISVFIVRSGFIYYKYV